MSSEGSDRGNSTHTQDWYQNTVEELRVVWESIRDQYLNDDDFSTSKYFEALGLNFEATRDWMMAEAVRAIVNDQLDGAQLMVVGFQAGVRFMERRAEAASTFLASIASAQSQGTREQTDWMIAQAREGLRQSGGHDFDAESAEQ